MLEGQPVVFGEVLFDCLPDGREVLGGAPFNVAWHLAGFGESPLIISRLGTDSRGERVRQAMLRHGMRLGGMQSDSQHPTGLVRVSLDQGQPTYSIEPRQAYDFIDSGLLPDLLAGRQLALVYHGSLATRAAASARALAQLLGQCDVPVFVDVNLRAPWWSLESVLNSLQRATYLKLNLDEFERLDQIAGSDLTERAQRFVQRHGLQWLLITCGSDGARLFVADGAVLTVPVDPVDRLADTVGAGDGFAAACILGLLHGWPAEQTIRRAAGLASAICAIPGAIPADREFYQRISRAWGE